MKRTITLLETASGHFYSVGDPELDENIYLPSSTNILQCFPMPQLNFWLENTSPEEIRRKQEDGKISGSKVHHCMELQIMGEKVSGNGLSEAQISRLGLTDRKLVSYLSQPLTEREEQALIGAENFWEAFKPITVGSELMVYSIKHGFAGTLDFIGYLWNKKTKKYEFWIVDWKISKSLNRSYDLQIASYWKAFCETYHKRLPKIRLGILQLGVNKCRYRFKEVKDKSKAFKMFLRTKELYDDINPNRQPKIISRREEFKLTKYKKKGRQIKL